MRIIPIQLAKHQLVRFEVIIDLFHQCCNRVGRFDIAAIKMIGLREGGS